MILKEIQIEVLKELINIAFGNSSAAIADLLESFATLELPEIDIIDSEFLNHNIKVRSQNNPVYTVQQTFNGSLSGESIFVIDTVSAKNLSNHLYKDVNHITQNHKNDSILELANIVSVTTISKLANITDLFTSFLAPTLKIVQDNNYVDFNDVNRYSKIIVIKTSLIFENENIAGSLYLLTNDDMISKLRDKINFIIKEQMPDYDDE